MAIPRNNGPALPMTAAGTEIPMAPAKPRLVHVDDLKDTLDAFARLFSARGWEVAKCHNLADAIAALARAPAQLLLVDLALDGASGLDVVVAARARYPELEIVVLTCSDPESVDAQCRAAGADRVLHKIAKADEILTPGPADGPASADPARPAVVPLRVVVARHIVRTLELYRGNLTRAASALEITVNTLKSHLARLREE